jgi:hypothetical protein
MTRAMIGAEYEVWQGGHSRGGSHADITSARGFASWRSKNPANADLGAIKIVEVTRKVVEEWP